MIMMSKSCNQKMYTFNKQATLSTFITNSTVTVHMMVCLFLLSIEVQNRKEKQKNLFRHWS